MSEQLIHTCLECEYQWLHGKDGSHSCVARLKIARDHFKVSLNGSRMAVKNLTESNDWQAERIAALNQEVKKLKDDLADHLEYKQKYLMVRGQLEAAEQHIKILQAQRDHAVKQEEVMRMLLNEEKAKAQHVQVPRPLPLTELQADSYEIHLHLLQARRIIERSIRQTTPP